MPSTFHPAFVIAFFSDTSSVYMWLPFLLLYSRYTGVPSFTGARHAVPSSFQPAFFTAARSADDVVYSMSPVFVFSSRQTVVDCVFAKTGTDVAAGPNVLPATAAATAMVIRNFLFLTKIPPLFFFFLR